MLEELLLGECSFEHTHNLIFKSIWSFTYVHFSIDLPVLKTIHIIAQSFNDIDRVTLESILLVSRSSPDVPFVDGNLQIDKLSGGFQASFQNITSLEKIEADEGE